MMRSQLDAVDPRLPGTGVFDLKTRAVVSIRMNHKDYEEGVGYQLRHNLGEWESFEREFYDMTRATMLKYSLQVRMGRMDGIFIAYHNIERIFGFQYLSLPDMDAVLHGQHDTVLGDSEFKLSLSLVDEILVKATNQFPDTSIRLHFEAREGKTPFMYVFAEPVTEEQADEIQNAGEAAQKEFARTVVGVGKDDPETQAAWREAQDDVDEQVGADQAPEEVTEQEDELLTQFEDSAEGVVEDASEDAVEGTEATMEDIMQPSAASEGPLMGWTLTVRSQVNGGYVERPENLNEHDDWKVEYHMKEIAEPTRWKLYNALKARRHQLVGQDDEAVDKGLKHYRDVIQRYSNRGRQWREEQDKLNDAKGVHLFRPLGPGSDNVAVGTEDVEELGTGDIEKTGTELVEEPETEVVEELETENVEKPETEVVDESDTELVKQSETDVVEKPETEDVEKSEVCDKPEAEKEEPYSEETKPDESLSKEKKEEVLDGLPSVPS